MKFRNLLFSLIIIFLFFGCTVDNRLSNSKDTFGIYLTKAEIKPEYIKLAYEQLQQFKDFVLPSLTIS